MSQETFQPDLAVAKVWHAAQELLRGAPLDVALSGWCKHWDPAAKALLWSQCNIDVPCEG